MLAWRSLIPTRRWLQVRLRTALLLATALCVYLAWPHISRQYTFWRLCRYADRDFADLWIVGESIWSIHPRSSDTETIEELTKRHLGLEDALFVNMYPCRPWAIRRLNSGSARLMIVLVRQVMMIPAQDDVRIVLLDGIGRIIADKTIHTGNRFCVTDVTYEPAGHGFPCVRVDCDVVLQPGLRKQQWIAIRQDRIAEVRIIRSGLEHGRWIPNYHQLGPNHRFSSHAAWSQALSSSDDIDVLEALLDLPPREAIEKRDAADIARLTELCRSPDPWIIEGATAALAEFAPPN